METWKARVKDSFLGSSLTHTLKGMCSHSLNGGGRKGRSVKSFGMSLGVGVGTGMLEPLTSAFEFL